MEEGIPLSSSGNTKLASSSSKSMSSVFEIMRKAIYVILKDKKSMLRIFTLVASPLTILIVLHTLIVLPLMAKVEDGYENSSLNRQDLISFVAIEIPFVFAFSLFLLFASAVTISATVAIHQGGAQSLALMETVFSIKWKNVFISRFYITFYMTIFIGATIVLTRLMAVMAVFAMLTYPYLASLCALVLAISTVEEEPSIKEVFKRAVRIIRRESFKGYALMLALMLLSMPVYIMFYVTSTDDDDENGLAARYGFALASTLLFCLTVIFNNVVYALFYLDCRQ